MNQGPIPLDAFDLAIAGALVLVAGLVSVALRMGLGRRLAWAALRTVVQLLLVGYVLHWVFRVDRAVVLCGILAVMVAAAGRAAIARAAWTYRGAYWRAFATLTVTAVVTTFTVTSAVIEVTPWYHPQYVIPLMGMVLGNGLTGISLALDQLLEVLRERRAQVEMDLALGASAWEAVREPLAAAVRRGMIPILNAMAVVGIVSLPGMMTGQILQGADPIEAVKYQIVVMFMLAAATAVGSMLITVLTCQRLFDRQHRLRWREITAT